MTRNKEEIEELKMKVREAEAAAAAAKEKVVEEELPVFSKSKMTAQRSGMCVYV